MFDVVAIGELLIDFTPEGKNDAGMHMFSRNPGGAPANVLAMNAILGGKTAFIGKVGQDEFGKFLRKTLEDAGIETSGLVMDEKVNTTLAFVHLFENGERSFSFYRNPGADMMLRWEEIDEKLVTNCRIFHFGSVSLTDEPCRSATLHAVELARKAGRIISFDPNYRPLLWKDAGEAVKVIKRCLPSADIIKVNEEEMELITGESDVSRGAEKLAQYGASLVIITLGPKGTFYRSMSVKGHVPAYNVRAIDTTGAGDAFMGALLFCLRNKTIEDVRQLDKPQTEEMISFANAAGSLTTTKKGAIPAMPSHDEIAAFRKSASLMFNF